LHIDEAQIGYNAYSILETARDETGRFLPTHLTLWGVDRPLAISYLTIPGIITFGLNEFGTRIGTAIVGALSIILVFLLTREIFSNKNLSIVTTLLFTLSPWHIVLSRATSEAVDSLTFYLLGIFFCWQALKKNSLILTTLGYLSFVLSFFFYHATRITIPFLLIFLEYWLGKRKEGLLMFSSSLPQFT
jgi:4-amino-4-deoxy-L-arabinose transferase-like glycosyltransferase